MASAATNALDLLYQHSLGDYTQTYKWEFHSWFNAMVPSDVIVRDGFVMYLPPIHIANVCSFNDYLQYFTHLPVYPH